MASSDVQHGPAKGGFYRCRCGEDFLVRGALEARMLTAGGPSIEELIEASSLGTPEARALRAQCPPEVAREIVRRSMEPEPDPLLDAATDALCNTLPETHHVTLAEEKRIAAAVLAAVAPLHAAVVAAARREGRAELAAEMQALAESVRQLRRGQ